MKIQLNKLIVISGCSGGGKSTLLSELSSQGYFVVSEIGREVVKEQLKVKGDGTPWQNEKLFCEMVIERSVTAYYLVQEKPLVFFDRCFLDNISYYQTLKIADAHKYDHLINDLRYYSVVLVVPPWKEIFCEDDERKHSFEDAVSEYQHLLKFYDQAGYNIVEIPKLSVKKRVEFLISSIV